MSVSARRVQTSPFHRDGLNKEFPPPILGNSSKEMTSSSTAATADDVCAHSGSGCADVTAPPFEDPEIFGRRCT